MEAINLTLSGRFAHFKKPDVNTYFYATYNNIHKVALCGIFGAILGLGGYTQLFEKNRGLKRGHLDYDDGYPEFYEKLKDFKFSIIPLVKQGYFSKKIQVFNNSVGYASKEKGGNLIIREQWLENPTWQILILENEADEYKQLKEYLLKQKAVYLPYLGKNDHPATLSRVEIIELGDTFFGHEIYINSLFKKEKNTFDSFAKEDEIPFLFEEVSPIKLQKDWHFYEYENLIFTNFLLDETPKDTYVYENKAYTFI